MTVTHLTYGEMIREHSSLRAADGTGINITWSLFRSLCKRSLVEAELTPDPIPAERPEGVCKACWKVLVSEGSRPTEGSQ